MHPRVLVEHAGVQPAVHALARPAAGEAVAPAQQVVKHCHHHRAVHVAPAAAVLKRQQQVGLAGEQKGWGVRAVGNQQGFGVEGARTLGCEGWTRSRLGWRGTGRQDCRMACMTTPAKGRWPGGGGGGTWIGCQALRNTPQALSAPSGEVMACNPLMPMLAYAWSPFVGSPQQPGHNRMMVCCEKHVVLYVRHLNPPAGSCLAAAPCHLQQQARQGRFR